MQARGRQAPRRRGRGNDRRYARRVCLAYQDLIIEIEKGHARGRDSNGIAMANPYTRSMAEFVAGLQYAAIPAEVRERAKLLILDALGCGLYGAHLEWSRILQQTLAQVDSSSSCAVWGTERRLSAPHATLANGTQVQGFELDDVHRAGVLHVGAVVLPALLAVAELRRNLSGEEFLAAAVAGYEIGPRVGLCMVPEPIGQGWHSGATV